MDGSQSEAALGENVKRESLTIAPRAQTSKFEVPTAKHEDAAAEKTIGEEEEELGETLGEGEEEGEMNEEEEEEEELIMIFGEGEEGLEEEGYILYTGRPSELDKKVTFTQDEKAKDDASPAATKRRKSIRLKPRKRLTSIADSIDMPRRISGDFRRGSDVYKGIDLGQIPDDDLQGEQSEEGEEEEEEEEEEYVDRSIYYERYDKISKEQMVAKMKNNFLQKKMAEYFKERKLEHVLKETDQQLDTQNKYEKKLDTLGELIEIDKTERLKINNELSELRAERNSKKFKLESLFTNMQDRENEIGKGLINSKTAFPIPDKLVDRLIKRQKTQTATIAKMRLDYIKVKNLVAEKEAKLKSLDDLGENLKLIDYEQLKVDYRNLSDKLEEREDELTRLRVQCKNAMQILAHMREKSAAIDTDKINLQEKLYDLHDTYKECREEMNNLKLKRNDYRSQITKMKENSGLLTQPLLLRDMEVALKEVNVARNELNSLEEEVKLKTVQVRNIRKNIENLIEEREYLGDKKSGSLSGRSKKGKAIKEN